MDLEAFDIERIVTQQNRYQAQHGDDDYRLKPSVERELDTAVQLAPIYSRLSATGRRVIRAIHSTPKLYAASERISRANLEFYVGRAGATARHVFNRFEYRFEERAHAGGIVICRCATDIAPLWEGVAVRIIKQLPAAEPIVRGERRRPRRWRHAEYGRVRHLPHLEGARSKGANFSGDG